MVVIASRQPNHRPETIRTRLARFMPSRAATGWSISWSAQTDCPEEIVDDLELRVAEHVGCYGAAVTHALAQAEVAPLRLRVTAETSTSDTGIQTVTMEVRALVPGLDQSVMEAIVRRAETACPVWRGLSAEVNLRPIAILEDPSAADSAPAPARPAAPATAEVNPARPRPTEAHAPAGAAMLARIALPRWLSPRMAVLMLIAIGAFAAVPRFAGA
jgi:hypothetical protein